MRGVKTKVRSKALAIGLLLVLAAAGCDRKNPLFLVPGKEDPPPGTTHTPQQTPKAASPAGSPQAGAPRP